MMVRRLWLALPIAVLLWGCEPPGPKPKGDTSPPPRAPITDFSAAPGYDPDWSAARSARNKAPAAPTASSRRSPTIGDPLRGRWSLAQATATLPPGERLVATLTTSAGELTCQLWADKAPTTVATFIGLANGIRPWKTKRGWLRTPAYDGGSVALIPRVPALTLGPAPNRMAPGPGLQIAAEPWPGMRLDRAGLLCMPTSHGGTALTLWITTAAAKNQAVAGDGGPASPIATVLGQCGPAEALAAMAKRAGGKAPDLELKQARVSRE